MATATPLTVEPDQRTLLETLASARTCSPEVLLREAIEEYVTRRSDADDEIIRAHDEAWARYDGPMLTREQFFAEGEEAYDDFLQTGLHLTHDEVNQWVDALIRDPKTPMPTCHK